MKEKQELSRINIIVVAGPTASGKSEIAIMLARRFNGEIISADSRQVYRGMDIGTGKVTRQERRLARHWMLDVASPRSQYSVAQFVKAARGAITDITRRGKLPIICGGTGFWIDALVYDLSLPSVKPDAKLRAQLQRLSTKQLFAKLEELDPVRASTIDRHNPARLIRALEIVMTTGQPVPPSHRSSPYNLLYLAISKSQKELNERIEKRLDARLRHGMIPEVKKLHANGIRWKRLEQFGLEYRWLARYLQGNVSKLDMRDGLLRDIIAYSKRQLTWFKRNKDIKWVTNENGVVSLAQEFLKQNTPPK